MAEADSAEVLPLIEKHPLWVVVLSTDRSDAGCVEVALRIKQRLLSVALVMIVDSDIADELLAAR